MKTLGGTVLAVLALGCGGTAPSVKGETKGGPGKRSLRELTQVEDPAWPLVKSWIAAAKNPVEVLPASALHEQALVDLQVTLHSTLGAIAYQTGGILVDHGWVRLLGSGHKRLPRMIFDWTLARQGDGQAPGQPPPFLLVGDDVVGGFYAVDGGIWGTQGHVHYFAPDSLKWEDTGKGYTDFVRWVLGGDLDKFYADYRWTGWQREVEAMAGDQGYSIWPPPIAKGEPFGRRSRRSIPIAELYDFYQYLASQLKNLPPGAQFEFKVTP